MSDKNKNTINIPVVPDSVDQAAQNLTAPITKNIGKTLADVWFLVFGGLSQKAAIRNMKYEHELQLYYEELQNSVSEIPAEKKLEPNIQITAQALENSKYCIESEELRKMFVNLISKSMNSDFKNNIHPSFAEIIKQMSPMDARIFKSLSPKTTFPLVDYILEYQDTHQYVVMYSEIYLPSIPNVDIKIVSSSISSLNRLGLINIDSQASAAIEGIYKPYEETDLFKKLTLFAPSVSPSAKASIAKHLGSISPLGRNFLEVCVK